MLAKLTVGITLDRVSNLLDRGETLGHHFVFKGNVILQLCEISSDKGPK